MTLEEWKKSHSEYKSYAHFDKRVSVNDVWKNISNPEYVSRHGFYPLIHYTQVFEKYHKEKDNRIKKKKEREICYSAHLDRCVFQYYAYLLNEKYNERVRQDQIDLVAVAYRNNLGKNNIDFAKIAFDFIREKNICYIMIGDFTSFFDNLEHFYLKKQLCSLLQSDILPNDYYAVFKNITKYSTWELTDLLTLNQLPDTKAGRKELNSKSAVLTLEQFRKNKKQYVHKHTDSFGIPQGSTISAVLANIYMLEADKAIHEYVKKYNGMYMRYSDDFIIILPVASNEYQQHYNWINYYFYNLPSVKLSPEKTQLFYYHQNQITSCNQEFMSGVINGQNKVNFLG
ncbi:MAG: hypothetical protein K2G88_10895, partial [Oscillospiraceae bacterium]|nr:hypothetical protein [Oscillospiraceae bacterium]